MIVGYMWEESTGLGMRLGYMLQITVIMYTCLASTSSTFNQPLDGRVECVEHAT